MKWVVLYVDATFIGGPPNGPVFFAPWRLLFVVGVVCCRRAGGLAAGRVGGRPPFAWAVGRSTLHGGPVRLRPVTATPCYFVS